MAAREVCMTWNRLRVTLLACLSGAAALTGCEAAAIDTAVDHYVAGRMAMDAQRYEEALAELEKAIEANPDLSIAHAAMGDIFRKQDQPVQAAGAYERACKANPYAFRPHYNLGVTYQLLSDTAEVAKIAGEYIRRAVGVYLRAVTLRPGDFDTNLNLAACYFQQGKFDLAEHYCKAAIELGPDNPFAQSNLGIIYDAQDRPYDAIAAYKTSLELDVHQPKLLGNLGSTYLRLGRMRDALRAFELAAKEDPTSADPHVQTGVCHYQAKDYAAAQASYEHAVKLDPKCAQAFRGLGVVHMTLWVTANDQDDTTLRDRALAAWDRSLELDSNQPDLLRLVRKYRPEVTGPEL